MRITKLNPGVGVSLCDGNYYGAVIDKEPGLLQSWISPREFSGRVLPGESLEDTITRALRKHVSFEPSVIGVSHHDRTTLHPWVSGHNLSITPVSPTLATLAGLKHIRTNGQTRLRAGHGGSDNVGLLKIGPRSVTFAIGLRSSQIDSSVISGFSSLAAEFAASVPAANRSNPVELLGNLGWCNAANFFEGRQGVAAPLPITEKLLFEWRFSPTRENRRRLVSHLCYQVMYDHNDEFSYEVATFMLELFGRTIGYAAQQAPLGQLYVQYNAISAVAGMPNWVTRPGYVRVTKAMAKDDRTSQRLSALPEVTLIGPRPQVAEAFGAIELAHQIAPVAAEL